ncbi:hypothetical protein ACTXGQ_15980 [Marinobacter sp. 1Y8]
MESWSTSELFNVIQPVSAATGLHSMVKNINQVDQNNRQDFPDDSGAAAYCPSK